MVHRMNFKKFKRGLVSVCIMSIALSGVSFADSTKTNKLSFVSGSTTQEGMNKLFEMKKKDTENFKRRLKNEASDDIKDEISYSVKINEKENEKAEVSLKGEFELNNKKCKFEAEGPVKILPIKSDNIYLGTLDGEIDIDGESKEIAVAYEKTIDNEYFALTINSLENEEGFAVIKSGKSVLTKETVKDLFDLKDPTSSSSRSRRSDYKRVDWNYKELDNNSSTRNTIRQYLYVEDDIYEANDDGDIVTRVYSYNDRVEDIFDDDYDVFEVQVNRLEAKFKSVNEESDFGNVSPAEEDDEGDVESFVQNLLGDLGVPWSVTDLVTGIGNDVNVYYENEEHYRKFKIYPENDSIIDNRDAGFPISIHIELDTVGATQDIIESNARIRYNVFYYDDITGSDWFTIDTEWTETSVDLALRPDFEEE